MAYSQLEDRYLNALAELEFPTLPPEPAPEEASLEGMQLAAGPSNTRTDAGPRYGRGGVTKAQSEAAGGFERPLTALADVTAGGARGGVVQAAGLGGDLEMIYNGLKSVFNRPEDQSRIDAFLAGMAVKTGMATSEQVSKEGFRIPLTDIQVKLPPVVPEGAADAKSRQVSANVGQAFGELAPLPGAIEAGIAGTKAIAKGAKALAPKVGEMVESYLTKTGAVLKVAPDAPAIEISTAPKPSTPAFKKWFGDSKAVDEKGQPLVVYHGTDQSFDEFRGNAYFTPVPEDASKYSYVNTPGKEHSPNVVPVYLSLQKPKTIKTYATRADIDDAKAAGFDGVIVQGVGGSKINHYIVFESTQIKSLFNKGTFDPKDPRILHGGGAAATGAATQGEEKK